MPREWTPRFPVVIVRDSGAWVARDDDELRTTQQQLIGMYEGLLVDSAGDARRIRSAAPAPEHAGPWGRTLQGVFPSRILTVDLEYEEGVERLSLDRVRELLLDSMDRRPENVRSHDMGLITEQEFRSRAAAVTSFEQLYLALRDYDTIPKELL